jgi:hypothetical protein
MSTKSLREVLNDGDPNTMGNAARQVQLGTIVAEGNARVVTEAGVAVAGAAATPKYTIQQLLYAKTIGTGVPAIKAPQINGATPAAGQAAPNAGGTSVTFHAETTGTGTCDLSYITTDAAKDKDGKVMKKLSESADGLY